MRVFRTTGRAWLWACVLVTAWPGMALAQLAVQYRMLTLVESAGIYSGLAMQAVLRLSSLRQLPQVIMVCCTMWLLYRRLTTSRPQPFMAVVAYLVSCTLILVLFWPEAAPRFFGATLTRVFPGAVTSYVAERNVMAVDDAGASGLVPASLATGTGAAVPRFTDLLLRVVTSVPLTLAEAIDTAGLQRPFQRIPVMTKLMEQDVPDDLTKAMPDFIEQCYKPASLNLVKAAGLTFQDILPWSSALHPHLTALELPSDQGMFASIASWWSGTPPAVVNCKQVYNTMETGVQNFLGGEVTQGGSNMQAVYQTALGMNAQSQARFFVQRELDRYLDAAVDAPSRIHNLRVAADAANALGGAVGNFDITAWGKSAATEYQKLMGRLSNFLAPASFLVHWAPYIIGFGMFATVGLFPIVLLWSLFPGQHFKPIVNYFLVLLFLCSTPLWWAMVNVTANLLYNVSVPTGAWFTAFPGWSGAQISYVVVTVIGIVMVPVIQAILLFGTWRAIGGIWHA